MSKHWITRRLLAFSLGMTVSILVVYVVDLSSPSLISQDISFLEGIGVATATFVGLLIGTMLWSSVGTFLKARAYSVTLLCVGMGIVAGLMFMGFLSLAGHFFVESIIPDPPSSDGADSFNEFFLWMTLALWNAVGFGVALSPSPSPADSGD